jgi:GMP synthase-like glutamine amidotransferase
MMRIAVLQHVPFEGPAAMGTWAAERGFPVSMIPLFAGAPCPRRETFEAVFILGGPMSVNDESRFAWLAPEKDFIRECLQCGKKVLGICLGAQLIAAALGSEVGPAPHREIGWFPVECDDGKNEGSNRSAVPGRFHALHWHGEMFQIPKRALGFARSEACVNQAFSVGRQALALQFHLESTPESVEALIRNCPGDLAPGPFVQEPQAILSARHHFREANRLMTRWLDRFLLAA